MQQAAAELEHGSAGLDSTTFLCFLSELAFVLLKYRERSGSRSRRQYLRRVAFQPLAADADVLRAIVQDYLRDPAPMSPIH